MNLGERCRRDFPILSRIVNGHPLVYLDSAASSQKPAAVIEAIQCYYETGHANVHRSIHTLGEEATERYEAARDAVRAFIGARGREEIVFTRGTTESINLVAQAMGRTLAPGDEIVVSELEHHSNLIPWQMVCRDRGTVIRAVPVLPEGYLDLEAYARLLSPRTRVVALATSPTCSAPSTRWRRWWSRPTGPAHWCCSTGRRRSRTCRSTSPRSGRTSTRSPATRCSAPPASECSTVAGKSSSASSPRGAGAR
jgi:Aminotransferase class-V